MTKRIPFSFLWQAPLQRRLWMAGIAIATFILTVAAANNFLSAEKAIDRKSMGMDFIAFYTGGNFYNTGKINQLYNLQSVKNFQHELAAQNGMEIGDAFGPFWNPPFYAMLFSPLARLPFEWATRAWLLINLACLATALTLLARMLPAGSTWKSKGLIALLTLTSMPLVQALSHAQNTCTSLLLLTLVVIWWRRAWESKRATIHLAAPRPRLDPALIAGLLAGLLFYKPQLGAVVAGMLILTLGWRAFLGLTITGGALVVLTQLTMPDMLEIYLHQLPVNIHFAQVEQTYLWERHVTLKAFWRLLLQGRAAGEMGGVARGLYLVTAGVVGGSLLMAAGRVLAGARRRLATGREIPFDLLIAATIIAMPLLMPFYFDYDLLLLVIPTVLIARTIMLNEMSMPAVVRWLAALYVATFVSAPIGSNFRLNLSVIALAGLAVTLARKIKAPALASTAADAPAKISYLAQAA